MKKMKAPKVKLEVRIEKEIDKRLGDLSEKYNRTRSEIVRKVLRENLPRVIRPKSTQKKKSKKKKSIWNASWF